MPIRKAQDKDIVAIADLAALKRRQYEQYRPVFHRVNENALESHKLFLRDNLSKDHMVVLVSEANHKLNGFAIGVLVNPPPVYNPGGKICLVDDFMVERPELWTTVGKDLLSQIGKIAKEKGAVLINVVCGPLDNPKRNLLSELSFNVASEWHVRNID